MRRLARLGFAGACAAVAAASLWGVVAVAPTAMPSLLPVLRMMLYASIGVAAIVGAAACLFGPANLMDMSPVEIWRWFWSRTPGGMLARIREMLRSGARGEK